jgi:hypothetical protein
MAMFTFPLFSPVKVCALHYFYIQKAELELTLLIFPPATAGPAHQIESFFS